MIVVEEKVAGRCGVMDDFVDAGIMRHDMSHGSRTFDWNWCGAPIAVGYDVQGNGSAVLLPVFSTVCSREEMAALAERLSGSFRAVTVASIRFGTRKCSWNGSRALVLGSFFRFLAKRHFDRVNRYRCDKAA